MWCTVYLCCLMAGGYPLVAGLSHGSSRLERWALCACLGPGIIGFCLIFLSLVGVLPNHTEILILSAIFLAGGIFVHSRRRDWSPSPINPVGAPRFWWAVCLIAMAFGMEVIASNVLAYPVVEWDAFAIWQLKAKVLARLPLIPIPDYFTNLNLAYSHLRYPLLVPMISAGVGAAHLDGLGKIPALLFFPALGAVVFTTVRRFNGTTAALSATALLLTLEPILRYGGSGTAEMALTAFYGCSLVCILRWQEQGDWGSLILAALFSACMSWTKNEGLALAAINALILPFTAKPAFSRHSFRALAVFVIIVGLIYLPWPIYSRGFPKTDEDYIFRLTPGAVFANVSRLPMIIKAIIKESLRVWNWGVFWVILVALTFLRRRILFTRPIATLWALLILHILAYFPPYMIAMWNINELLRVTTDRLLMHAAPAGALLIGFLWPTFSSAPSSPP